MNLLRAGEEGGVARKGEEGESDTSRKARGGEIYVLPYGTRLMSVRNLVPILVRTRVYRETNRVGFPRRRLAQGYYL
jgi:hypothetical protein